MQIKPVRIMITTTTSELDTESLFGELPLPDGEDDSFDTAGRADDTPIIFESDGIMTLNDGELRVSYVERQPNGEENHTVISFREDRPTSVSMISGGSGPTALVFDSVNRRCGCVYNFGPFPLEVTICTERMTNNINYKTGGKLHAEYTVEIRGVAAEFDRITVKVEPIANASDRLMQKYRRIIDTIK